MTGLDATGLVLVPKTLAEVRAQIAQMGEHARWEREKET